MSTPQFRTSSSTNSDSSEEKLHFQTDQLYQSEQPADNVIQQKRRKLWYIWGGVIFIILLITVIFISIFVPRARNAAAQSVNDSTSSSAIMSTNIVSSSSAVSPPSRSTNIETAISSINRFSNIPTTATASPTSSAIILPTSSPIISNVREHRIVIFGASYCDDGHQRESQFQSSLKKPPYFDGRSSNGPVWPEYLQNMIVNSSLLNYAYVYTRGMRNISEQNQIIFQKIKSKIKITNHGAMIDNSLTSAAVPDTKNQIATFLEDLKSGKVSPLPIGSKTIVMIWAGINPMINLWLEGIGNGASITSKKRSAGASIALQNAALSEQLNSLRTILDATDNPADFMILKTPPLESIPFTIYNALLKTPNSQSASVAFMKFINDEYNQGVVATSQTMAQKSSSKSEIITFDVTPWYEGIFQNPPSVGLSNVKTPCYFYGDKCCSDPTTHFFWDSVHMATQTHQQFATAVHNVLKTRWI